MKVSKNTWHYTLFAMGDSGFDYRSDWHVGSPTDLCNYMRKMFLGFLFSLLLIIIGLALSTVILDAPISIALYFITDNSLIPFLSEGTFGIGSIIYGFCIFGFVMWFLFDYLGLRIPEPVKESISKSESLKLVKTGYKSFKDKTCVLIEVNPNVK